MQSTPVTPVTPAAPVPTVTSVMPASVVAGSVAQAITVTGSGFTASSAVQIDGAALPTTLVSSTSLTAALTDALLANGRITNITVTNGASGGASSAFSWNVMSPTPTISGLSPASVPQGAAALVTVNGSGFEANSTVLWNGAARTTTFVSPTVLQVQLTVADVQAYGAGQVTVNNPGPGGSATSPAALSVVPTFAVASVAPAALTVGSATQTISITGSGFAAGTGVSLDTLALQTTVVNATTLQAVVPASALITARAAKVTITVPGATPTTSTSLSLPINSALPVLTAVTPANLAQGKAASVTLTGTGFQADTSVLFNGTAKPATVTSGTSLQVALTAADLQMLGAAKLAVSNPSPGGGTSATLSVNVVAAATITAVAPNALYATGPAQNLTITGSGFIYGATASLDGTALPTTYSSATTLLAIVPPSLLLTTRNASLVVTVNGTTSNTYSLPVNSMPPVLSYASPGSIAQGQTATILLSGYNFQQSSVVQLNGVAKPTTYLSISQLQFSLTTADTQTGGTLAITVSTPGSNGGVSGVLNFAVIAPPAITAVIPASIMATADTQTVAVSGTGFSYGSTVTLDGVSLQTTYLSSTQLTATIPAASLLNGRTAAMQATAGSSGTGASSTFSYPITSPTPAPSSLSPSAVPVGQAATVTVNGSGFEGNSSVQWNGAVRPTTFRNPSTLLVALSATDLPGTGTGSITVNNPGPGSSTSAPLSLNIANIPVVLSLTPASLSIVPASSSAASVVINGTNFATGATVQAGGAPLSITAQSATQITASVPASYLASPGSLALTVTNPPQGSTPLVSAPAYLGITQAGTGFSVSPSSAAVGSNDLTITVTGTGLYPDSVIQFNGVPLATTYVSTRQVTAIIPAATLGKLGAATLLVQTPENTGAAPTLPFTVYESLPTNDLVFNSTDGLIYATVPGSAGPGLGNSLVAFDPTTGVIQKTIPVGSEPNRVVISQDGTQAFVGLDKAGAVRQVNLTTNTAGVQFSMGGGPGVYNPPYTASNMAAVPGQPNAVAIYSTSGVVTIYDSGVARPNSSKGLNTYFSSNYGGLAFGGTASTLYVSSQAVGSYVYQLTVDATGITAVKTLQAAGSGNTLQYDNGRLYFPSGVVADASSGAQLGQFSIASGSTSNSTPVAAAGPIVSDSSLGLAFILSTGYYSNLANQLLSYNENTFNGVASLQMTGITGTAADLIRWGSTGVAFRTPTQVFVIQGPVVNNAVGTPADIAITAQPVATATTGNTATYQFTISNSGPNTASGISTVVTLPASLISGTVTTSQGSCIGSGQIFCNLGQLASGSSATIAVSAIPTTAGTAQVGALLSSLTFDPVSANNQVRVDTAVTGALYSPAPSISSLSPSGVASGATGFTLTVNGKGFTSASSILWNGTALPTTFVNATKLTASVSTSLVTTLGWAQVSVSSNAPGGGVSGALTLSIYSIVNVPANAMVYDKFTRRLYATLPSTAQGFTGNSIVSIDPLTGSTGTPVSVGSEPNLLSETSNGNYLFVGLSGAKSIARFNLLANSTDQVVPLTSTASYNSGAVAAVAIAAVPGSDTSLAVETNSFNGIGIFDTSGSTGRFRTSISGAYDGDNPVFVDATHFYAYDSSTTGAEFYRYTIDAAGVHLVDGTTLLGTGGFSGRFAVDGGRVFFNGGGIANPMTTPPSQVAVLPLANSYGGIVVPYTAEQKSFNFNSSNSSVASLQRFDLKQFVLEDTLQLPANLSTGVSNAVRWGQDGIAAVLPTSSGSTQSATVLVLRGPFVVPTETQVNLVPSITSAGSAIAVGSGNQSLTVTGTGFLPGASVKWNGVILQTDFIDAQHLSAAVGARDVATAGSVNITVQNPGSTESPATSVLVQ